MTAILKIPKQDGPRERLARYGRGGVSTIELLAILLGSGTKGRPVLELAADLLAHFGSVKKLSEATHAELKNLKGIGPAKALQLQAAFALIGRLEEEPSKVSLKNPESVYQAIRFDLEKEQTEALLIVLRDAKRYMVHKEIVGKGTLTELLIHPREIFHVAIRYRAHSAIIAHNHPSGDPVPSTRDLEATEIVAAAGRVVGIELVDHLIIGKNSYVSLYQKGMFKRTSY